jgi:hypothetical protein
LRWIIGTRKGPAVTERKRHPHLLPHERYLPRWRFFQSKGPDAADKPQRIGPEAAAIGAAGDADGISGAILSALGLLVLAIVSFIVKVRPLGYAGLGLACLGIALLVLSILRWTQSYRMGRRYRRNRESEYSIG